MGKAIKHQRLIAVKYRDSFGAVQLASPMVYYLKKGRESMLTAKQEAFVQNIIQGMSQADAYRSAYPNQKMSDKTVCEAASRLMGNSKVLARLTELRKELAKPSIMSAQERMEWLTEVINGDNDINAKLKAIDIMNKMQGEYVQKVEAEVKNAVNISIELSDD